MSEGRDENQSINLIQRRGTIVWAAISISIGMPSLLRVVGSFIQRNGKTISTGSPVSVDVGFHGHASLVSVGV
jgi:hypothetical protein